MRLLLGVDLGTSYFKVGLFEENGTLRGLGRVAVEASAPAPGRSELGAETFWALLRRAFSEALTRAGAEPRDIAGMSYSSQANTFILLDRGDLPLSPLILWTDTRAAPAPEHLAFSNSAAFSRAVGFNTVAAESAVTKWHWWRIHEREQWARAQCVLTISDYFTHALTGERVGDASTAALLGLYHLHDRRWWDEALTGFGIEAGRLARPLPPGTPCGRTRSEAARLLGVPAGIPFAVGALDHHAAAIGAGLDVFADVSISIGTVLAATCLVDRVEHLAGCFHGPHFDGRRFYRLAFNPNGAGALEEYQRRFAPGRTIDQLIAEAATVPAGSTAAAAPDSATAAGQQGAAVRSLLERMAFAQRELVSRISRGQLPRTIAATGGGARNAAWLALTADVMGTPIVTSTSPERACLGAAVFAAAAAGVHPTIDAAARAMVRLHQRFGPPPGR
ncbi:MAG: FGGY-family carbohydrate kinase [Opitutaceae bacterium]|nr:FGGY-family carbohydrate kinase [Opitutaceae bacterium]